MNKQQADEFAQSICSKICSIGLLRSYSEIALKLNERGLRTRNGRLFRAQTVKNVTLRLQIPLRHIVASIGALCADAMSIDARRALVGGGILIGLNRIEHTVSAVSLVDLTTTEAPLSDVMSAGHADLGDQDFTDALNAAPARSDIGIQTDSRAATNAGVQTSPAEISRGGVKHVGTQTESPAATGPVDQSPDATAPVDQSPADPDESQQPMPGAFRESPLGNHLWSHAGSTESVSAAADPAENTENVVRQHAINATPENVSRLLTALADPDQMGRAVDGAELKRLNDEYYLRNTLRSVAFGAVSASGYVADQVATDLINSVAPKSLLNRVPVGVFLAGPISTLVHTVFKGAGPKSAMSVGSLPYAKLAGSDFDLAGQNIVNSDPYSSLGSAGNFTNAALAVSGIQGWPATAIRVTSGIAGFMARGIKTFRSNEAMRTAGGTNPVWPWLDAGDLEKTKSAISDLRQSRPVALSGYVADIGSAIRDRLGGATKVLGTSPRVPAYIAALTAGGVVGGLGRAAEAAARDATTPAAAATAAAQQLGFSFLSNWMHTKGLQQRLNVEWYMTQAVSQTASHLGLGAVDWTHKGALANAGLDAKPTQVGDLEQGMMTPSDDAATSPRIDLDVSSERSSFERGEESPPDR